MHHHNEQVRAASINAAFKSGTPEETIPVFAQRFGSWQLSVERQAFSTRELTRLYDRAAPGWGQMLDRLHFPQAYEALLRNVLSTRAPDPGDVGTRVLDCGVGSAALSSALARVLPAPFALDAIDISPRMLEQAKRNLHDIKRDVTFRQGDVRELPYSDGIFDIAMTAHVLEHLVDPGVALDEMARVLKPGGLLIACITRRSTLGMLVHLKWRTHRVTPTQAESWLNESGLENVRCLSLCDGTLSRHLSVACVGQKPLAGGRKPTLNLGDPDRDQSCPN